MRALVDNAFVSLIGTVLDSKPGDCVTPSGALALFHLAEHILFDEEITVSNAPGSPTYQRVKAIIDSLQDEGVLATDGGSLLTIKALDLETHHATACRRAAARLSNLLHVEKAAVEFERWGKDAMGWQQALGGGIFDFERFVKEGPITLPFLDLVKARGNVPAAEEEYVVRSNHTLQTHIGTWLDDTGSLSVPKRVALSALTRLYINEALSGSLNVLYAPVPQRIPLADQANRLVTRRTKFSYRNRLNDTLAAVLREQGREYIVPLLHEMEVLDAFPLPLLAFHLLSQRQVRMNGPLGILEEARRARDSEEARRMRAYLVDWEEKLARSPNDAMDALSKMKRVVDKELKRDMGLSASKSSNTASIKFPLLFGVELNLEGLDLRLPEIRLFKAWTQQQRMQHHFLPSVARTPTNPEGDFDIWFNQALDRRICPEAYELRA